MQIGCGRPSQYDDATPRGQRVTDDGKPFIALCGWCIAAVMDPAPNDEFPSSRSRALRPE